MPTCEFNVGVLPSVAGGMFNTVDIIICVSNSNSTNKQSPHQRLSSNQQSLNRRSRPRVALWDIEEVYCGGLPVGGESSVAVVALRCY